MRQAGSEQKTSVGPDGADTVMMQEDCVFEGGQVRLKPGIKRGANRRHAGEDVAAGSVALRAGTRLKPADLGLAALIALAVGTRGFVPLWLALGLFALGIVAIQVRGGTVEQRVPVP